MQKYHILAIDDEKAILALLKKILKHYDYRVSCAADGNEGLKLFCQEPPDLVILDVNMPGRNGFSVMSAMREVHPDTPILMLTGAVLFSQAVANPENAPDAYLDKPFKGKDLLQSIQYLLPE